MDKVIITGADGFIGSHLVKYLSENSIEVYAIIVKNSLTKKRIEGLQSVHIIEAENNEYSVITKFLPTQPVAFFHLAWAGVAPEKRDDIELQYINIHMTMEAIKLAHKLNAEKFIMPGSTLEYTECDGEICEKTIPNPQNLYGAAKLAIRYFGSAACNQYGIHFVYAVISSIYSADRIDNNVITYTINKLLKKEKPSLTKLEQLWDYVYIDDVVNALYLLATKELSKNFYTIGHGDNCPLSEYIFKIRDLIDKNLPLGIGEVPYKNNAIPNLCINLQPLIEDTGFFPKVSFDEGIQRVIRQIKKQKEGNN